MSTGSSELPGRDLLIYDSLACGLGDGGANLAQAVHGRGAMKRLAFVLLGLCEDGAMELAGISNSVNQGIPGPSGDVASHNPSAVCSLSGS